MRFFEKGKAIEGQTEVENVIDLYPNYEEKNQN
jgi:hypothetical protein